MTCDLRDIPGYNGKYLVTLEGEVYNAIGHRIKPMESRKGLMVELRKDGQRELLLVDDIVKQTWGDRLDT